MAAYYQNAGLDQEEQLTSIKRFRSPIIKKNKATEKLFTARREATTGRPNQYPPPPPVATLGPGPVDIQKNLQIWGKTRGLGQTRWSRVLGKPWWIFLKYAVFLIILKLIIFS